MAQLGYSQTMGYWISAGGDPAVAAIAAAITYPESGNDPSTVQQNQPYATTGWGLWQITPGNSEPQCGTDQALLDPANNACAAVAKWKGAGQSFTPWRTFTGGEYRQYLQTGTQATAEGSAGSSTPSSFPSVIGNAISSATSGLSKSALGTVLALLGLAIVGVAVWIAVSQTDVGRQLAASAKRAVATAALVVK